MAFLAPFRKPAPAASLWPSWRSPKAPSKPRVSQTSLRNWPFIIYELHLSFNWLSLPLQLASESNGYLWLFLITYTEEEEEGTVKVYGFPSVEDA